MENINNLAKEHFTKKFMNEFKEGTEIKNGEETYKFNHIKFNTNYTHYDLIFKKVSDNQTLFIKYDNKGKYYLGYGIEDNLDAKSKNIIKDMFKYMK